MNEPGNEAIQATIHDQLLGLVEMVLFGNRSIDETARLLQQRPVQQQRQFIEGAEQIARSSIELTYLYCESALPALDQIDPADWQLWVTHLLDCYEHSGAQQASAAMQQTQPFVAMRRDSAAAVTLESARKLLEPFLNGLAGSSGRTFKLLADAQHCYSDTDTLHLPPQLACFSDPDRNLSLYKAMLVHQWAQTRYRSWRTSPSAALQRYDDRQRALALFHGLERLRLDACIARDLPGMAREMAALRSAQDEPVLDEAWQAAAAVLKRPESSVSDCYQLLPALYDSDAEPPPCCYQGELRPDLTEPVLQARQADNRQRLALVLRELIDQRHAAPSANAEMDAKPDAHQPAIAVTRIDDSHAPDGKRMQLTLDDEAVPLSSEAQALLHAIAEDNGDIPQDYLRAAEPGQNEQPGSGYAAPQDDETAICYDEWDHQRKQYRSQWCQLQEREIAPVWDDFVADTLGKYRGVIKQLRRTFEALRGQDRRLRKQPYGDDVDLDALVESIADQRAGLDPSERVFVRHQRLERDIAVMFMVDMSASTKGWINHTEREALLLLCEALQTLGDRYAVYGFTSNTRERCEVLPIKRFDEAYSDQVQARISGIRARDYTRMGAAFRHLTALLQGTGARTRLLITLSDGRPDDSDGYRGRYGMEDTRQAVLEAHAAGVHPFCITIDDQGRDYLSHLFGPSGFAVVDKVEHLPLKVSDIYRKLTM